MFYSTNVLQKKGPLGAIWIAAHHDVAKKLTKLQIMNTDIVKTAGQIENPEMEMSLRLSSHLLAGLSRIYTKKVQFLFTDCNEALSKITLAFRPSNVDLGPVNKAQIKSITIDESALVHMDFDLELDLQDSDWLAPQVITSQGSAAEITLPETASRKRAASSAWEEEDALLGGSWVAEDNPLDLGFDDAEMGRRDGLNEAPEKHRSSDQVHLNEIGNHNEDMEIPDALDLPGFEMEPEIPMARPSDALSMSLLDTPGVKSLDESSMMSLVLPTIGVKKQAAKQAAKKRKPAAPVNQSTEIAKIEMRRWIESSEAVAELVRNPRPLPLNRLEGQQVYYSELQRKGRLAEVMLSQPLLGFVGSRLRKSLFENDSSEREVNVKKRKERDDEIDAPDLNVQNDDVLQPDFPEDAGAGLFEDPTNDDFDKSALNDIPVSERRSEADGAPGIFENTVDDIDEELEEGQAKKANTTEQTERTKKMVAMLKKEFRTSGNSLKFQTIIRSESSAPTRHTAAAAFFECLGLHAKGVIKIKQPEPYSAITLESTPALATFKVVV